MEVEEEKEFSFKTNQKQTMEMKDVLNRDPEMGLKIEQKNIQHLCEVIARIFTMFSSGKKSFLKK